MPQTNAERRKKYLEKLKANGQFDAYKQKKAAEAKARRDRVKEGLKNLPKAVREKTKRLNRAYSRKKQAEYRQRKKGLQLPKPSENVSPNVPAEQETGYKTASARSKAFSKLKRALPSTTSKQMDLVSKLFHSFSAVQQAEIIEGKPAETKTSRAIAPDVIMAVQSFFERDNVSRMSPNVKDCRSFINETTGMKEVRQIRYLQHKLEDVYNMFIAHIQNGDSTISPPVYLSKFCELRPEHVKLVGNTPLETCFCLYHSNFTLCSSAINQFLPEFPKYGAALYNVLLCNDPKKACWLRDCSDCSNKEVEKTISDIVKRSSKDVNTSLKWTQWKKDKDSSRFQQIVETGTIVDLKNHFMSILTEFMKHSYTKRCQAAIFESDNEEVRRSNGEVVLAQLDFAESFNCEAQDEIQAAHWNQPTV